MQCYVAIANLHLQCIQDPYCRRLRPQHVGLKLRFSSLVSVGRLLAILGRPARRGGGDCGRRRAAGGGVAANVREMVEMRANNNYQKHRRWRQKVGEKNKIENDHKRGFSDTKYLHNFFFLYFLWDNKCNQLDNSWIFGIFALFTFIAFRAKQSCR